MILYLQQVTSHKFADPTQLTAQLRYTQLYHTLYGFRGSLQTYNRTTTCGFCKIALRQTNTSDPLHIFYQFRCFHRTINNYLGSPVSENKLHYTLHTTHYTLHTTHYTLHITIYFIIIYTFYTFIFLLRQTFSRFHIS